MEERNEKYVSIKLASDGSNFAVWKFAMKIVLRNLDLMEIVSGITRKPVITGDDADTQVKAWIKKDNEAQKWIVTSVSEQNMVHLMVCESSEQMWKRLEAVHGRSSEAAVNTAMQKFYGLKYDGDSIAKHIAKVEDLAHQLNTMGEKITNNMMINKILSTLPPSFDHFHSAWDSTQEKTMENLLTRLLLEEERINSRNKDESVESNALVARKFNKNKDGRCWEDISGYKSGTCFNCGKKGHWKNECRSKRNLISENKQNLKGKFCYYCKKPGHIKQDCWHKKGKDESKSESKHALIATEGKIMKHDWILDSGASDHMSYRADWFEQDNFTYFEKPRKVKVGNNDFIEALGEGNIEIKAYNGATWKSATIKKVLYVPDIANNLFSEGAALDKGLKYESDKGECTFYKNGTVVATGRRFGKLFKMNFRLSENSECEAHIATVMDWHRRLGHQNMQHIRQVLKNFGIKAEDKKENFCEGCILGKQHRLPFPTSKNREIIPGKLIHIDLCGPMEKDSIGGSRYFILFKDDASSFRTVYFIKQKSETKNIILKHIKLVENDTGNRVGILRTDNGTEFIGRLVKDIVEEHGIRHQLTTAYAPEQNGRVERDNRTIVESARTMLLEKGMGTQFWAEAINTAVYVINRTGNSPKERKTPYEVYFKKSPNWTHLRTFGCEAYAHIPKQKRKKWSPKSKKGIFVGYSENIKGYKIYFQESKTFEFHRDVIFKERETTDFIDRSINSKNVEDKNKNDIELIEEVKESENLEGDTNEYEEREEGEIPVSKNILTLRNRETLKKPSWYSDYVTTLAVEEEPDTPTEALKGDFANEWRKAMEEEMDALNKNKTWELTELPPGKRAIPNRWIFRIKRNESNIRYKARLVVKGYQQQYEVDYFETFSPVVKFSSIRIILATAATYNLELAQFDVKTAFLNGKLNEEIFMHQPEGYEDGTNRVCRLRKSLYGLKQAPKCWNQELTRTLEEFNMTSSKTDPCVFIRNSEAKLILALYVDDGLIAASSESDVQELLSHLQKKYELTINKPSQLLGMTINREADGSIYIHQEAYAQAVLKRFVMTDANPVSTPAEIGINLDEHTSSEAKNKPYREAIGSLLYLTTTTRPDLAFIVNRLSRYTETPLEIHWKSIKRVLRYVKGTMKHGILYSSHGPKELTTYSDADFANDASRKSTTGYVIKYAGGAVMWKSSKQSTIALSTAEAEYVAAAEATKELMWLRTLSMELKTIGTNPILFYVDNRSAIHLIKNDNGSASRRTKHIDIKYHFIREKQQEKIIDVQHVSTEQQEADIFTKPLPKDRFNYLKDCITGINN